MKASQQFLTFLKAVVILSAAATLISFCFLPVCYNRDGSIGWPTTSGVVADVALKTSYKKPGRTTYFSPSICYGYTVDGIPRVSTKIDFTNSPEFPKAEALAWLNQNYPVGKKVTVYYDPDDPDLAVLVPGAKESIFDCWTAVATAACCWVVSWVFLILERKRCASERPR